MEVIFIKVFTRIKKSIRKKYILQKYKRNYGSGKLIYLKDSDRQYGLTFILMKDSIENNIPILVPNNTSKKYMAHEMYKMGQLGFATPVTEDFALRNLIITPTENNVRGRKIEKILVDNQCTIVDILNLRNIDIRIKIVNGFVTAPLMA